MAVISGALLLQAGEVTAVIPSPLVGMTAPTSRVSCACCWSPGSIHGCYLGCFAPPGWGDHCSHPFSTGRDDSTHKQDELCSLPVLQGASMAVISGALLLQAGEVTAAIPAPLVGMIAPISRVSCARCRSSKEHPWLLSQVLCSSRLGRSLQPSLLHW